MKTSYSLAAIMLAFFYLFNPANIEAQTQPSGKTYSITSNKTWSNTVFTTGVVQTASSCSTCSFYISNNASFTMDVTNVTCNNCSFYINQTSTNTSGTTSSLVIGAITVNFAGNNNNIDIAAAASASVPFSSSGSTINVTGSGASLDIYAHNNSSAPINFLNTIINLAGSSASNGAILTLENSNTSTNTKYNFTGSTINVTNKSTFNVNSDMALNTTNIIVGDVNSTASTASISIGTGATISLDNSSSIRLGNVNNKITGSSSNTALIVHNATTLYQGVISYNRSGSAPAPYNGVPYSTSGCSNFGSTTSCSVTISGPSITGNSNTAFISISPLPVILVDFNAVYNNKTTLISWNTQQEINSSHFDVERSGDGTNWLVIGTVQAKGNSPLVNDYSFIDQSPLSGLNYYRLKMVDLDEKYGYTEIKAIRTSLTFGISIFPNPAKDFVNVSISKAASDLSIRMINQLGQVMQETKVTNGTTTIVSIPTHNYPQGTYMLQIKGSDGTQQTSKVLVIK